MSTLKQDITIAASREAVWEAIVDPVKYEQWTQVFSEGSTFEGGWNAGDSIRFVAVNPEGQPEGMFSEIAESRYPEYISVRHLGMYRNGEEDHTSEEAKAWTPSYENYTLEDAGGGTTRFIVDMDLPAEHLSMFEELWAKSLADLKRVAEASTDKPMRLTVRAVVPRPAASAWQAFTEAEHVMGWNHASEDWHCPQARNNLVVGGRFCYTMAARSGKAAFDFEGTYTDISPLEALSFVLDDGRTVSVTFKAVPRGVLVEETFEAEGMNSLKLQREGWQAILNNFAAYVSDHF